MHAETNPLLGVWSTPYGLPPFATLRPEHFEAAFEQGMREHNADVEAIAQTPGPATFENTIAAFDKAGRLLKRTDLLFQNLTASETSPALQAIELTLAPKVASHYASMLTNAALFARIDAVHSQRQSLGLNTEAMRLVERIHLDFELAGARLSGDAKARYVAVVEKLASLTTTFEQNVLADESSFTLPLTEADCTGLPPFLLDAMSSAAKQRGLPEGTRALALSRSLVMPFLTLSPRRDLREQIWRAWTTRGEHAGAHDNTPVSKEILALRAEQARLRGQVSYADAALIDRMAKKPSAVFDLLGKVWEPAKTAANRDRAMLLELAAADGITKLEAWDWRYYAEKVRKARFDLDDAELKPYFALEDMIQAMFDCASRLFGVAFEEKENVALYHPDVRLWEVSKAGKLIGIFIGDNFARPTKRGGAWMHVFRKQSALEGGTIPLVINNNNFSKPSAGAPSLLSFDDVRTLFHEFGHGLHGLLSNAHYETLACTEVLQDYVELPSQIFEHWAQEESVLRQHARHVETREPIPTSLLEKLQRARRFDQAFATIQYVGSALLDMALHSRTDVNGVDIAAFERDERARLGVPEDIGLMHRLPHFRHLFSSSAYAAGYYVYMWAEVLDADGFDAFKEAGSPFDAAVAERLYRFVYSAGNTIEPADGYRAFRGRDPKVEPMLKKRGLIEAGA
jgi:peptidyl-dipeptidase Dcp